MEFINEGLRRIQAGEGLLISVTGMLIVFVALIGISVFLGALPRILRAVAVVFPDESTKTAADDERVVIAIGVALHHRKYGANAKQGT